MTFTNPHATLLQLALTEGMTVGDFGCGSGHYALAAAAVVGKKGKVHAVDVQQDLLTRLKDDAKRRNFHNIDFVWGDIEKKGGSNLPKHSLDAVVLSDTCFQLDDTQEAIQEVKRVMKPGGKLLLVEWSGTHQGIGPTKDRVIEPSAADALFLSAGFTKVKECVVGAHHYAIVFAAPLLH